MVLAMYEIWKALSSHHSLLQGGHGWWWEMEHVGSKLFQTLHHCKQYRPKGYKV